MTENESLKLMESLQISHDCEMVKTLDFQETVIRALETLQQYRAIGTIEELKSLKEKSVSKKTNIKNCCANCVYAEGYTGFDDFYCIAKKCGIRAEHYGCVKFKKI